MTFAQYKRLFLVLLIPMIFLGSWLADTEYLFEQHFLTECTEHDDHYYCSTIQIKRGSAQQYRYDMGGVWVGYSARLSNGFSAEVITTPQIEKYTENGENREREVGGGIKKKIQISSMHGSGTHSGACSLDLTTNPKWWFLTCLKAEVFQGFRIVDPALHAKYAEAVTQAREEALKYSRMGRIGYWVSFAVPLIAFLILSFAFWILLRLARFVRGPTTT